MRSEISTSPHPAFPGGRPLEVGNRFLLVPGDVPAEDGDRIVIRLARGKAFGSGLHETTASCMEALEKLGPLKDRTVLDVGTGTGILSLAALKMGAAWAVAFDIDADSARTSKLNTAINGLKDQMAVFLGTLDAVGPAANFNLVMANIHGDIILKGATQLAALTGEGGHMILSGLDYTDSAPVKAAMGRNGMEEVAVTFLEEYVTQVWRRPPARDRKGP